jgi:phage baseplate assembly protein W
MGYEIISAGEAVTDENAIYGVDFKFNTSGVFESMKTTIKQVRANLKNLLLTQLGERYFLPEFGSELLEVLFQPNTDELKPIIQDIIFRAVQKWMPYLGVNVDITTADDDPRLTDSVRVTVRGFVDDLTLDPIVIFASPDGLAVTGDSN